MMKRHRPWGDYATRLLACILLFGASFALLSTSTFALRMRDDIPLSVAGLDGVRALALVLAAVLSLAPLLAGRAFLGAFLTSGWLVTGIGGYWWTTIPWDDLITESGFPSPRAPGYWDYALVAGPALIATLYVVLARVSQVKASALTRGIDPREATHAACVSFLTGAGAIVLSLTLMTAMWATLTFGVPSWSHSGLPTGIGALVMCGAIVVVAWAVATRRARFPLRRPSRGAKDPAAQEQSLARRSPS